MQCMVGRGTGSDAAAAWLALLLATAAGIAGGGDCTSTFTGTDDVMLTSEWRQACVSTHVKSMAGQASKQASKHGSQSNRGARISRRNFATTAESTREERK
jgi:hypothetical protein